MNNVKNDCMLCLKNKNFVVVIKLKILSKYKSIFIFFKMDKRKEGRLV